MGRTAASAFLDALSGPAKRKNFCTVDIESKAEDTQQAGFTRPFLVGTYDPMRRVYEEFRDEPHLGSRDWKTRYVDPGGCVDKVLTYLLSAPFKNYQIYSHNGGNFDELFFLPWLRRHEDEFGFEVVPVQSSIQVIKVWRLPTEVEEPIRDRWTFLDSMKLFPMGLEKMCKTFGLPGKVDHDLDMHETDERWSTYLKQDCVALAEGLIKIHELVEDKLGGEVGMTAPSTSMKLFRRRFLGRPGSVKKIPRFQHWHGCDGKADDGGECQGCAHQWVRRGYYGGRTELFRVYGENLHYYDINSSYVAAMREEMPVGDRTVLTGEDAEIDWRRTAKEGGFVECTVKIPATCDLPPLPHRSEKTGKLIFPTGVFSGVWSTRELALLKDPSVNGEILSVKRVVWFRLKPVFEGMVQELWRLRDKNQEDYDEGLSALAKLLGNSLYGKFGMKEQRTSIVFSDARDDGHCFLCQKTATGGLCNECVGSKPATDDEDCDVWYQKKKVEASYIIPHIAAWITSLARERLWRFMRQAADAGGKIFYCDTDSIITDVMLPSSSALGELKDEYPLIVAGGPELAHSFSSPEEALGWLNAMLPRGTFVQPKVYMLESQRFKTAKVTMKGFPYRNVDAPKAHGKDCSCSECIIRHKENLLKLQRGEALTWRQLEKVRTLARGGFRHGPKMKQISKSFKSEYDKRVILPDGSTRPQVLDEREDELFHDRDGAAQ